jgi:hypothetical protein
MPAGEAVGQTAIGARQYRGGGLEIITRETLGEVGGAFPFVQPERRWQYRSHSIVPASPEPHQMKSQKPPSQDQLQVRYQSMDLIDLKQLVGSGNLEGDARALAHSILEARQRTESIAQPAVPSRRSKVKKGISNGLAILLGIIIYRIAVKLLQSMGVLD